MPNNIISCPNCSNKYKISQKENGDLYVSEHIRRSTDYKKNPAWKKKNDEKTSPITTMLLVVVFGGFLLFGTNQGRQVLQKFLGIPADTLGISDETVAPLHPSPVRKMTPVLNRLSTPSTEALPNNGILDMFTSSKRLAPFTITTPSGAHYFLKIVESQTGKTVMTLFIRAGLTLTTKAPLGLFKIKVASGREWFGKKLLFGVQTKYGLLDNDFTFSFTENAKGKVFHGNTLTLKSIVGGNIHTKPISKHDF